MDGRRMRSLMGERYEIWAELVEFMAPHVRIPAEVLAGDAATVREWKRRAMQVIIGVTPEQARKMTADELRQLLSDRRRAVASGVPLVENLTELHDDYAATLCASMAYKMKYETPLFPRG